MPRAARACISSVMYAASRSAASKLARAPSSSPAFCLISPSQRCRSDGDCAPGPCPRRSPYIPSRTVATPVRSLPDRGLSRLSSSSTCSRIAPTTPSTSSADSSQSSAALRASHCSNPLRGDLIPSYSIPAVAVRVPSPVAQARASARRPSSPVWNCRSSEFVRAPGSSRASSWTCSAHASSRAVRLSLASS